MSHHRYIVIISRFDNGFEILQGEPKIYFNSRPPLFNMVSYHFPGMIMIFNHHSLLSINTRVGIQVATGEENPGQLFFRKIKGLIKPKWMPRISHSGDPIL